jgi:hypothetical protein
MEQKSEELKDILCKAIKEQGLVKFYYESDKSKRKEWRIVEPYILGIKENGNIFLAALPTEELGKNIKNRSLGHFLLNKIDLTRFERLKKKYTTPNVERRWIITTPHIKVICRFVYDDEKIVNNIHR